MRYEARRPEAEPAAKTKWPVGSRQNALGTGSVEAWPVAAKADAPEPGAIQWLLLRVKSRQGSGPLSTAAYIRRIDTKGGAAPKTGCDAHHLSEQARMRYSATYQFFRTAK